MLSPLNALINFYHYRFYIQAKDGYIRVICYLVIKAFTGLTISFNPRDVVPSFLELNQIFSEKTSVSKVKKHPSQGKPPYSQNPS